jgi:quinoprotein glucose dehydrogenase
MWRKVACGLAVAVAAWAVSSGTLPTFAQQTGEWPTYAGNKLAQKYSPLDQITRDNVKNLRIVWRQSVSPPEVRQARPNAPVPSEYQHTPLMVGGLLYIKTGLNSVAALDPATGKVVWAEAPPQDGGRRGQREGQAGEGQPAGAGRQGAPAPPPAAGGGAVRPSRGLAYWTDGQDARVIAVTGRFLVALNAKTGQRYSGFGDGGQVDLAKEYDVRLTTPVGGFGWSSHPIVVRDVIVVGGGPSLAVEENAPGLVRREAPPGDIRGFDARTGKRLWSFHVVPRSGEFGYDTWLKDSAVYSGNAGTWSWLSADEELGYVYVPTEHATSDFFGGTRPGNNLFADSVLCLDAKTGKRIWHFQTIHHGIWDWDLPTAPILADITVNGRRIKAAVQLSKMAYAYVLDRETGKPVWPIEERRVPQGDAPGEWYSPTQPVPTKPPAYEMQGVTLNDLIDFTPELRQEAVKVLSKYRYGPMYLPASPKQAIIMNPGTVGGSNWNGGAFDPETGMLYVPTIRLPTIVEVIPPRNPASTVALVRKSTALDTNLELPIGGGLPILKPPYGSVVAIDLNKGDITWRVPNGNGPRDHPALKSLNLPPLGTLGRPSPLLTKTLLFIGEGMGRGSARIPSYGGGKMFRAYDKKTGKVIWETELPGGTSGAPMTYMVNGKQYIVVGVGWEGQPAELIALALP